MSPPTPLSPAPTEIDISPPCPLLFAEPEAMLTEPAGPADDTPVDRVIEPLFPELPAAAVLMTIFPLVVAELAPDVNEIAPPDDDVDCPPVSVISPPTPLLPVPGARLMAPPLPDAPLLPVLMVTVPESPDDEVPEERITAPLVPLPPADAEANVILPVEPDPLPDVTVTAALFELCRVRPVVPVKEAVLEDDTLIVPPELIVTCVSSIVTRLDDALSLIRMFPLDPPLLLPGFKITDPPIPEAEVPPVISTFPPVCPSPPVAVTAPPTLAELAPAFTVTAAPATL
jgi:hypothetical protein